MTLEWWLNFLAALAFGSIVFIVIMLAVAYGADRLSEVINRLWSKVSPVTSARLQALYLTCLLLFAIVIVAINIVWIITDISGWWSAVVEGLKMLGTHPECPAPCF